MRDLPVYLASELSDLRVGGGGLGEGFNGGGFVFGDVEDGVELGDLHYVGDFVIDVEELEVAALFARGGERADEGAESHTVYVFDAGEIEQDLFVPFAQQIENHVADGGAFFAHSDATFDVYDGDGAYLADVSGQAHDGLLKGFWYLHQNMGKRSAQGFVGAEMGVRGAGVKDAAKMAALRKAGTMSRGRTGCGGVEIGRSQRNTD